MIENTCVKPGRLYWFLGKFDENCMADYHILLPWRKYQKNSFFFQERIVCIKKLLILNRLFTQSDINVKKEKRKERILTGLKCVTRKRSEPCPFPLKQAQSNSYPLPPRLYSDKILAHDS